MEDLPCGGRDATRAERGATCFIFVLRFSLDVVSLDCFLSVLVGFVFAAFGFVVEDAFLLSPILQHVGSPSKTKCFKRARYGLTKTGHPQRQRLLSAWDGGHDLYVPTLCIQPQRMQGAAITTPITVKPKCSIHYTETPLHVILLFDRRTEHFTLTLDQTNAFK